MFGNQYDNPNNLWKDSDNYGVSNYYEKRDREVRAPIGESIYTGSRGGKYYINSNGNKTYISQ